MKTNVKIEKLREVNERILKIICLMETELFINNDPKVNLESPKR